MVLPRVYPGGFYFVFLRRKAYVAYKHRGTDFFIPFEL